MICVFCKRWTFSGERPDPSIACCQQCADIPTGFRNRRKRGTAASEQGKTGRFQAVTQEALLALCRDGDKMGVFGDTLGKTPGQNNGRAMEK